MAELGISRAEAEAYVDNCTVVPSIVLREGMTQDAAQALTFALRGVGALRPGGEIPEQPEPSSPPPPPAGDPPADEGRGDMGFGGTVAAVIVGVIAALLLLSLF